MDVEKFLAEAAEEESADAARTPLERVEAGLAAVDRWRFYPCGENAWEASGQPVFLGSAAMRVELRGDEVAYSLRSGLTVPKDRLAEMRKYIMAANARFVLRGFALDGDEVVFSCRQHVDDIDVEDVVSRASYSLRDDFADLCAVAAGAGGMRVFRDHLLKD